MTPDALETPAGRRYLEEHYLEKEKSTYAIARELGTYANKVRDALIHHGVALRSRSGAQKAALASGRSRPPSRGRRSKEQRDRIGDSQTAAWHAHTPERRAGRARAARRQWDRMSEAQKEALKRTAQEGLRRAARQGSRLERFLADGLSQRGMRVVARPPGGADLYLPDSRTAIDVLGLSHHLPVFGQEVLEAAQQAAQQRARLLSRQGVTVVRVHDRSTSWSQSRARAVLARLLEALEARPAPGSIIDVEASWPKKASS